MRGGVFGSQYGTQGEAAAILRIVRDGDAVCLRVVADAVDARYLALADGCDGQYSLLRFPLLGRSQLPTVLAVEVRQDVLGQGDGSAARCVQLMDVVCFGHAHVVSRELVHDAGQLSVDGREDGYAQTEVARPEQRLASFGAKFSDFFPMLLQPTCAARNQLHARLERAHVVAIGRRRVGELDGHVGRTERFGVEVLLIVDVDDAHYLVPPAQGDLLDGLAHLAIADQCYFHFVIKVYRYTSDYIVTQR